MKAWVLGRAYDTSGEVADGSIQCLLYPFLLGQTSFQIGSSHVIYVLDCLRQLSYPWVQYLASKSSCIEAHIGSHRHMK